MKDGAGAGGGGSRTASWVGAGSEPLAGGSIAVGGKKLAASTAAEPRLGEPRQLENHAEGRRGSPAGSAWQLGVVLEEAPAATARSRMRLGATIFPRIPEIPKISIIVFSLTHLFPAPYRSRRYKRPHARKRTTSSRSRRRTSSRRRDLYGRVGSDRTWFRGRL